MQARTIEQRTLHALSVLAMPPSRTNTPRGDPPGSETPRTPRGGPMAFFGQVKEGYDEVR